ncbi:hypothetical protein VNO77_10886 [Canavalia gladiata]|uniref:Uncharacterized protein n=1 Tax=Canavalia gladiata TaxID=3824 RepID=A0AAN9QY28_CANGL
MSHYVIFKIHSVLGLTSVFKLGSTYSCKKPTHLSINPSKNPSAWWRYQRLLQNPTKTLHYRYDYTMLEIA